MAPANNVTAHTVRDIKKLGIYAPGAYFQDGSGIYFCTM
jgi:hypothetical protein